MGVSPPVEASNLKPEHPLNRHWQHRETDWWYRSADRQKSGHQEQRMLRLFMTLLGSFIGGPYGPSDSDRSRHSLMSLGQEGQISA